MWFATGTQCTPKACKAGFPHPHTDPSVIPTGSSLLRAIINSQLQGLQKYCITPRITFHCAIPPWRRYHLNLTTYNLGVLGHPHHRASKREPEFPQDHVVKASSSFSQEPPPWPPPLPKIWVCQTNTTAHQKCNMKWK